MSKCKHEYVPGPRSWPNICKHCDRLQSDIEIEELTTQRDALLAACEEALAYIEMDERSPSYALGHGTSGDLYNRAQDMIAKAKGESNAA